MIRFLSLLLVLVFAEVCSANELARNAVSEDSALSAPAIEELRSLGPAGLKTLA